MLGELSSLSKPYETTVDSKISRQVKLFCVMIKIILKAWPELIVMKVTKLNIRCLRLVRNISILVWRQQTKQVACINRTVAKFHWLNKASGSSTLLAQLKVRTQTHIHAVDGIIFNNGIRHKSNNPQWLLCSGENLQS